MQENCVREKRMEHIEIILALNILILVVLVAQFLYFSKRFDKVDKRLNNFDKNYLKTYEKDRKRISALEEAVGI